ncbi:hypothetical protein HDU97_006407 [Phlyctochytrium planicorne]|nr:hypothetical protein HDU97_006407 [Phlyctochytrium planicorne]
MITTPMGEPNPIESKNYLFAESLLRGSMAVSLPASAGLPSAGGGMFKPGSDELIDVKDGELSASLSKGTRSKRGSAVFVKTARNGSSTWTSNSSLATGLSVRTSASSKVETTKQDSEKPLAASDTRAKEGKEKQPKEATTKKKKDKDAKDTNKERRSSFTRSQREIPTAVGILSSLTSSAGKIGEGLPKAAEKRWDSVNTLRTRRRSNSWMDLNNEHFRTRKSDSNAIPGLCVSAMPSTPKVSNDVYLRHSTASALDNVTVGIFSVEELKSNRMKAQVNLTRRLKAYATKTLKADKMHKYQISLKLQESMEREKKEKDMERKAFMQQRAEIIYVNEIMKLVEEIKWLRIQNAANLEPERCDIEAFAEEQMKKIPDIGCHDSIRKIVGAAIAGEMDQQQSV